VEERPPEAEVEEEAAEEEVVEVVVVSASTGMLHMVVLLDRTIGATRSR
jgi:hypothetical protein